MDDILLAASVTEALMQAPLAAIDLTDWVFTLTDADYQACSKNHIAAAATRTPEGKRLSINVERVGNLLIQHYVEDIAERSRCRLVSASDSIGPDIGSRVKLGVVWSFTAVAVDADTTKFTNSVEVHATPEYLAALAQRGIPLDQAAAGAQQALSAHNAEETPLFARNIERKALAGRWL